MTPGTPRAWHRGLIAVKWDGGKRRARPGRASTLGAVTVLGDVAGPGESAVGRPSDPGRAGSARTSGRLGDGLKGPGGGRHRSGLAPRRGRRGVRCRPRGPRASSPATSRTSAWSIRAGGPRGCSPGPLASVPAQPTGGLDGAAGEKPLPPSRGCGPTRRACRSAAGTRRTRSLLTRSSRPTTSRSLDRAVGPAQERPRRTGRRHPAARGPRPPADPEARPPPGRFWTPVPGTTTVIARLGLGGHARPSPGRTRCPRPTSLLTDFSALASSVVCSTSTGTRPDRWRRVSERHRGRGDGFEACRRPRGRDPRRGRPPSGPAR